jgi:hypothetical protein
MGFKLRFFGIFGSRSEFREGLSDASIETNRALERSGVFGHPREFACN